MTLDEVCEKIEIEFPRDISLSNAEKLLGYIAKEMPADIHYYTSQHKSLYKFPDDQETKLRPGTSGLSGNISRRYKPFSFDSFSFLISNKETSEFKGMCFGMIPGYNLSEYDPKTQQLWADTRKLVEKYFK